MRIFLSSRYSRRDELREIRRVLQSQGYDVVSRWLDSDWNETEREGIYAGGTQSSAAPPEYREEYAVKDLEDVAGCDVLICFSEPPRSGTRGGRHAELGAALALGKQVILVGAPEHIFHHHPLIGHVIEYVQGHVYGILSALDLLRRKDA